MGIFGTFWALVQVGMFGVLAAFAYRDYTQNWAGVKAVTGGVMDLLNVHVLRIGPDEAEQARRLIADRGARVQKLRETIAGLEANIEMAKRKASEQHDLAEQYRVILDIALREGNEKDAGRVAEVVAQYEERASMYLETAQEQEAVVTKLEVELEEADVDFEMVRTQAERVQVNHDIAEARAGLYEVVSDVIAQTGLSPKGDLKALLDRSEHKKIAAGKMLTRARRDGARQGVEVGEQLALSPSAAAELAEATKRLNLLETGSVEANGSGVNNLEGDDIEVTAIEA